MLGGEAGAEWKEVKVGGVKTVKSVRLCKIRA